MSAKPRHVRLDQFSARARAIIRCARSRSARPRSLSSAATTAPSICARKRSCATIRCASPTGCIIGPTAAPDRVFMAERNAARGWRQITYAELLASSRHIASALLARGLSAEKPVVILSGNSIDHALIAFGALYAGIPFCPVSPAYSLVSRDYGKLGYLMKLLTPGPRVRRRRRRNSPMRWPPTYPLAPRSRLRSARCPDATSPRWRT